MAISKITLNGVIQMDLTGDTVTAQTLLDNYTAHGADGTAITGEYVAPTPKTADDVIVSGATVTIPAGAYSSQVQKSVASGTAGTPTASKGAVNNHSIAVTPSVTNTTGYITGSTKTGTAVTVTASELASGNKNITANGSNIDVVGYSTVSVDVQSGANCPIFTCDANDDVTCNMTYAECTTYLNQIPEPNGALLIYESNPSSPDSLIYTKTENSAYYFSFLGTGWTYDIIYNSNGTITADWNSSWAVESLTATANGTYTPTGGKRFFDSVTVNVSSSGGSDYTYIGSTEFTVSTSSTTAINVGTFQTGDSSIWTSAKMLFIKIRDKAGRRDGYYYGSDAVIYNTGPGNGATWTTTTNVYGGYYRQTSGTLYMPGIYYKQSSGGSTYGYGIYPTTLGDTGDIVFNAKYTSSSGIATGTINGTFVVEVYTLKYPNDITPFDDDYS